MNERRRPITHDEIAAVIALLAEAFPKCFAVFEQRRRPLKVGIHSDILARLDGVLTEHELRRALRAYVGNGVYRRRLLAGTPRIDLDGNPVGEVTADEAAQACQKIAAAVRKTPQPAPQPKRDGLAALKAAALRRKGAVDSANQIASALNQLRRDVAARTSAARRNNRRQ